jgi:flagellar basal-body rod protein FlgG
MFHEIVKRATTNATTQFQKLGYVSTNLVNYSTPAYKVKDFELFLDEAGRIKGTLRGDASKGAIELSKNPLDVAIDGPGYFVVTKHDGSTAYTRDGRFIVNARGYLSTLTGEIIGSGIKVPVNYFKLYFEPDGTVNIKIKEEDDKRAIGKLNIVNFPSPGNLKDAGKNLVVPTEASGSPQTVENPSYIKQYATETSNMNFFETMSQILRTNSSFISSMKLVKYTDQIYRQSINLRQ